MTSLLTSTKSTKRPVQKKQNKLGPYNLLQTLGEGEFGKVKLGVHSETGQEVAIKLIKKEGVGSDSRINKVEREISVLKTLNHPYIVKLYNVVETEKYIGIILEYASGGELFEYILAHRYLKEKDAKRFFAQLISSVQYMHKRKIVHRDLKLENLLLDKNRNIIVTDFGFANQFTSAADDMMATTCGSPCYAAPELVVNAGLYAGSAVDIWSCGVILYAMLCGFLPFDDDPLNPDSDNINQLYRYILSTHLMFPAYVSEDARDLLQRMLVPDPAKRCSLDYIIRHPWLSNYRDSLRKDPSRMRAEVLSTSKVSATPIVPIEIEENKSNLILINSVSTIVPSSSDKILVEESQTASRKTHIPVVSRDRFAPVTNEKFLLTKNNKKVMAPSTSSASAAVDSKTGAFKHFSIGRSSATTTPVDCPTVHATVTPTTTTRNSKVPSFITRKPLKPEDETFMENVDIKAEYHNPEKSLSSPLSTLESRGPTVTALGSIRKNQRRGTDKFLSFFTGGRASHVPVSGCDQTETSIFNMVKVDSNKQEDINKTNESYLEDSIMNEDYHEDNHRKNAVHPYCETSTISDASTPSLCMSSGTSDPSSPLSLNTTHQQQMILKTKPAVTTTTNSTTSHRLSSVQVHINTSISSLSLNEDHAATSPTIVSDTIEEEIEDESSPNEVFPTTPFSFRDEETHSNISRQQQQSKDRGSSMSAASVLSDNSVSLNSSILSFKEAPRRTPAIYSPQNIVTSSLIMRQQQQYGGDRTSSILSSDIHDNVSISSAGTTSPRPEVTTSGKFVAKSIVSNAMGDGGRKAMAAVRRSIYRKHRSQPPPSQLETASQNSATRDPIISLGRGRFDERRSNENSHRNTWSSNVMIIPSSSETPGTKPEVIISSNKSTTTSSKTAVTAIATAVAPASAPKKTGKKMMDWIKKKSHTKETKKEMHTTQPITKLNSSTQILTRPKKQSTRPSSPAVIPKAGTHVTASNKNNAQTSISRKHIVSILEPARKPRVSTSPVLSSPSASPSKQKKIEEPVTIPKKPTQRESNSSRDETQSSVSVNISIDERIQIHQGAIDRSALTSQPPADTIKDIKRILRILGIEAKTEAGNSPYVLKCARRKAKSFITAEMLKKNKHDGDEDYLENVYKSHDDQFVINDSNITTTSDMSLLGPTQIDSHSVSSASSSGIATDARGLEPIYGDPSIDNGDEVRFAVEVCRFKNLPGLYIVDIRRLKGSVWAYKFLYHKLIDFLNSERDSDYVL